MDGINTMKPIYLRLSKPYSSLDIASSRFWGNPALPAGIDYPQYIDDEGDEYPYVFICQINLKQLKEFDSGNPLPAEGLLLFFAKIDHYLGMFAATDCIGGSVSDPEAVKVIYVKDLTDLREIVLTDDDDHPLSPDEMEISFTYEHDPINDEDHSLFARPDHREWETWEHPYEDFYILLQVDSFSGMDFNLNFMDFGVSQVRAIVLST